MRILSILYKKDSKGNLRQWGIRTKGDSIIEEYGLVDGNLVTTMKTCKGKNIGRSNETTPEEQAVKEAEAKFDKKLKTGYFEDIEEAKKSRVLKPMLAKKWDDHKHRTQYPCYVQPKYDGIRAIWTGEKLITRQREEITTMGHIVEVLKENHIKTTLDGELYVHGMSLQNHMSIISSYKQGESEKVIYMVYDCIMDTDFKQRSQTARNVIFEMNTSLVRFSKTWRITSEDEIDQLHEQNLEYGYEGTMIRWGDDSYKIDGRSDKLLKRKDFKDLSCEIVDIVPMDSRPEQGKVVCVYNGHRFDVTPKMSHEDREELLQNKEYYIGKIAEIKFFEFTDKGIPKFANYIGLRMDKEKGDDRVNPHGGQDISEGKNKG